MGGSSIRLEVERHDAEGAKDRNQVGPRVEKTGSSGGEEGGGGERLVGKGRS